MLYRYHHADGRTGKGSTSYNAVIDALGEDEASEVVDGMNFQTEYFEVIGQRANIYDKDATLIGFLIKDPKED